MKFFCKLQKALILFIFQIVYLEVFFILYHFIFYYFNTTENFSISINDIFIGISIMLRFDLNTIAYISLPLFLGILIFSFLPISISKIKFMIRYYFHFALFVFLFIFLIDIPFYRNLGTHLNHQLYNHAQWNEILSILKMVNGMYPLYIAIPAFLLFSFFLISFKNKLEMKIIPFIQFLETRKINKWIFPFVPILYFILLRGSLGIYPLNWGTSCFSNNEFYNDNTLNGAYTLFKSIHQTLMDNKRNVNLEYLKKVPYHQALDSTITMLKNTNSKEKWFDDTEKYLFDRQLLIDSIQSKPPNIVIILMESFTSHYCGMTGGNPDVTPNFNQLAEEGVFFTRFYANGFRSNSGISSSICSFPSTMGTSYMKQLEGKNVPSLAAFLKPWGYHSVFIYGGDSNFDNMRGFLLKSGFDEILDMNDMTSSFKNKWGYPDETIFEAAHERFCQYEEEPFIGYLFTLTNHEPFELPPWIEPYYPDSLDNHEFLNTYRYSDECLGKFFKSASNAPYFKNTIFFITADHSKYIRGIANTHITRFRIPACLYAPGIERLQGMKVDEICGQIDIVPTLLSLLNLPVKHSSFGRNIFAIPDDEGYALYTKGNLIGFRYKKYYLIDNIKGNCNIYKVSDDDNEMKELNDEKMKNELQTKSRVLIQAAQYTFKKGLTGLKKYER